MTKVVIIGKKETIKANGSGGKTVKPASYLDSRDSLTSKWIRYHRDENYGEDN